METKYYDIKLSEAEIRVMLSVIEQYKNIAYNNNFLGIKVIIRNIYTELQRALIKI